MEVHGLMKTDPALAPPDAPPPTACPSCGSRELTTSSKTVDASTYWRCVRCGEVWNVARRKGGGRRPYGGGGGYW